MLENFLSYISAQKLIDSTDTVLCAVSGGVDSMVLGALMSQSKIPFAVGHINHQLRSTESDLDAAFVRNYCVNNGIRYHHVAIPHDFFEQGNMHAKARNFRYQWLQNTALDHGYSRIATAHHLNDQVETFLMNAMRGAGLDGLKGIQPLSNNIIRPLLWATKDQILNFAIEHQIKWREDASNATDKYARNKVRHGIIPAIKSVRQDAPQIIAKTMQNIGSSQNLLESLVKEKAAQITTSNGINIVLNINAINQEVRAEFIYQYLKRYGFANAQCLSMGHINTTESKLFISSSHHCIVKDGLLTLIPGNPSVNVAASIWTELPFVGKIGNKQLSITIVDRKSITSFTHGIIYLDANKISNRVELRSWQAGDRIKPLGLSGKTKSVQDIFTDRKLSLTEKQEAIILLSEDQIAAVIPYQTSEVFKIDEKTEVVVVCEITERK